MTELPDAELLSDRAVRPVRSDEIARVHRSVAASVARPHGRGHAVRVLINCDSLRRILDLCSETSGGTEEDRLEADLRDEEPR